MSYHYFFFCLLHLACAAFSSTYLPPIELSCSITAPITLSPPLSHFPFFDTYLFPKAAPLGSDGKHKRRDKETEIQFTAS